MYGHYIKLLLASTFFPFRISNFKFVTLINMCVSSIKPQEKKQKEEQTNSCSHSLHTIFACGQQLPLLLLPGGDGGWTVTAGSGLAAKQRSVNKSVVKLAGWVNWNKNISLSLWADGPVSSLRWPCVGAPGGTRWWRPGPVSAGLCAQCHHWSGWTGSSCARSGEGLVWLQARRPLDRHSRRRPWSHQCAGERR